jgi:iron(III) transport system ATP-binding protein
VQSGAVPVSVQISGVAKRFGSLVAVDDVTLTVQPGSVTAVLGPSGSGKSTLLRVVAGFEVPDAGSVEIGGQPVTGPETWVEPEARRVGMLFQHGALFPHLTAARNAEFGATRRGRGAECLDLVGLADRGRAYPHELSGGERQRVALARALAADPQVMLLDEPFTALDPGLRERVRADVMAILRRAGTTALLVTHDQDEALSTADTVALLREGRLEQIGAPQDLYDRPATRWAAEFLGDANLVPARVSDGVGASDLGPLRVPGAPDGSVVAVVRPEAIALGGGDVEGVVVDRTFFGHDQLVRLTLPSGLLVRCRTLGGDAPPPGRRVTMRVVEAVSTLPGEPDPERLEGQRAGAGA